MVFATPCAGLFAKKLSCADDFVNKTVSTRFVCSHIIITFGVTLNRMTSAQLAMANDEIVDLNATLSELQSEEKVLQAKYELAFDLNEIESQMISSGSMVKASAGQTTYLDLSAGDNVVYYAAAEQGLSGLIRQIEQFLAGLLA